MEWVKPLVPPERTELLLLVNEIRLQAGAVASGITQGKDNRWVRGQLELIEIKLQALKEEL